MRAKRKNVARKTDKNGPAKAAKTSDRPLDVSEEKELIVTLQNIAIKLRIHSVQMTKASNSG
jgi:hypothetical protein